jgi:hypothetical protein
MNLSPNNVNSNINWIMIERIRDERAEELDSLSVLAKDIKDTYLRFRIIEAPTGYNSNEMSVGFKIVWR